MQPVHILLLKQFSHLESLNLLNDSNLFIIFLYCTPSKTSESYTLPILNFSISVNIKQGYISPNTETE